MKEFMGVRLPQLLFTHNPNLHRRNTWRIPAFPTDTPGPSQLTWYNGYSRARPVESIQKCRGSIPITSKSSSFSVAFSTSSISIPPLYLLPRFLRSISRFLLDHFTDPDSDVPKPRPTLLQRLHQRLLHEIPRLQRRELRHALRGQESKGTGALGQ